jgi:hypothetical protein
VRRENVLENRRGYAVYSASGIASAPTALLTYLKRIIAHQGTTLSYDNGSGTFAAYSGSYTAPTSSKVRAIEARSNLYLTTDAGVKALTDLAGTAARLTGLPRALDPSYALNAAVTGFLAASAQCAYRCVITRTDANSNTLYSYPSSRLVAYNTAVTTKNVDLRVDLPSEVTTTDVIQFYRSAQIAGTSSDLAGDEMALVYQVSPTSTDITNKYLSFTDSITDSLRGAALYTNSSQEGIAQGNDRPPLCKDLALYKSNFLFFANTSTKQRLNFSMVGTSGLSGKTLTLGGVSYAFAGAENTATGTAAVSATGVVATDIDLTARSLCRVINRYASNTTVYAYYVSSSDDLPGKILIEERGVGASAFTLQASDTTIQAMFFPPPPVGTTNSLSASSNSVQKNGLYFSKTQQPEHVPALNYVLVGPANTEILRIAPLRDSLIIIKEEGVYRLTGDTVQNFSVQPLDLTVYCKSADSVAVLANQIFMLTNQGIVAISDNGVQIVSREIEPEILPLLSYANVDDYTFGVGYESDRTYLLSTVTESDDTAPTQTFVYNIFTRTWTRYTFGFTSAIVEPATDKLFFTKSAVTAVYRERKDFADTDYADPDVSITLASIVGRVVVFTLATDTPAAGWAISQGSSDIIIDSVETSGTTHTATLRFTPPATWTTGAATLLPGISMVAVYDTWSGGQPGILKRVRQMSVLTDNIGDNSSNTSLILTFKSGFDGSTDEIALDSSASRWGQSQWGMFDWGGVSDIFAYSTYLPANKQTCRILNPGLKHANANEKVSINGISLTYDFIKEKVSR